MIQATFQSPRGASTRLQGGFAILTDGIRGAGVSLNLPVHSFQPVFFASFDSGLQNFSASGGRQQILVSGALRATAAPRRRHEGRPQEGTGGGQTPASSAF